MFLSTNLYGSNCKAVEIPNRETVLKPISPIWQLVLVENRYVYYA
jgi:hypothetical protein